MLVSKSPQPTNLPIYHFPTCSQLPKRPNTTNIRFHTLSTENRDSNLKKTSPGGWEAVALPPLFLSTENGRRPGPSAAGVCHFAARVVESTLRSFVTLHGQQT